MNLEEQSFAIPVYVPEAFEVEGQFVRGVPWHPMIVGGFIGRSKVSGERLILISHEMPLSVFPSLIRLEKPQLESLHFESFETDHLVALGTRAYSGVTGGADPPDFQGFSNGKKRGVDCVQFTGEGRRLVYAETEAIRRNFFDAGPERFSHLYGLLIYVWVRVENGSLGLPLRPKHNELLDRLAAFRFKPGSGTVQGPGIPANAPDFGIEYTDAGWGFYATPFSNAVPVTPFLQRMGFELAFIYNTWHSMTAVWSEVGRLIRQHDKPAINDLLFTVGGPDRNGFIYPAEDYIFDFMLTEPQPISPAPGHIERVLAHNWGTGRITQLHPEYSVVHPGRFHSYVPGHRPLREAVAK